MTQLAQEIYNPRTGQRMIFRKTGKNTNGTLLEIESFNPQSLTKEPEHVHPFQESSAEVLAGKLHFSINGKILTLGPGEKVIIPPGVPHYFWNNSPIVAHSIQRFTPALNIENFFKTYFALARDGKLNEKGMPNLFLTARVSLHFKNEIRITNPPWFVQKMLFSVLSPIGLLLGFKKEYK